MIWATRVLAILGLWFVLSLVVFGILPALRHLRRRNVVWVNTQYFEDDDDDDPIDAELRAFFDQDTDR